MTAVKIPAGLRLRVPVFFIGDDNKPYAVENPHVTSSDETVAAGEIEVVNVDGQDIPNYYMLAHRKGIGNATLTVLGDAEIGEGEQDIAGSYDVTCAPVEASAVKFGDPTTEPDPTIAPDTVSELTAAAGVSAEPGTAAEKVAN